MVIIMQRGIIDKLINELDNETKNYKYTMYQGHHICPLKSSQMTNYSCKMKYINVSNPVLVHCCTLPRSLIPTLQIQLGN